ncbi:MAG: aminotransferase class I/II-fold pyridoxal phosphate-dependent enzyme [Deltaproteobacteria bacterium]|nr:aminotransferase class I/II-fold pyridoxal phosphate-dependent enzyme [Deltaproteobacteria bacterium]
MPRFPNVSEHAHSASHRVYSNLEQRALAEKQHIYRLHVGDTYRDPVPAAQAERQLSSEHPGLHNYAPVHGEPSLIDAFIAYVEGRHGETLNPDLVQVMSGATAGLSVVCQVLLELGDEVLLPSPFWPLSRGVIATKGAVPVQVPFYTRLDEPGHTPQPDRACALRRHDRRHDARRQASRLVGAHRRGVRGDLLRPRTTRRRVEARRHPGPGYRVSHTVQDLRTKAS